MKDLDVNNLEKSMLFSDLEDEDEPSQSFGRQNSVICHLRKESNRSLNENENSVPKSLKAQRKKSVMSYALEGVEEEASDVASPMKSTRSTVNLAN